MNLEAVVVICVMGGLILAPLVVAYRAWRNGHRGWAIVLIVTTFFGMSWLVAIVALGQTGPSAPEEVRCPKCAGEPSSKVTTFHKETDKKLREIDVLFALCILVICTPFMMVGVELLSGSDTSTVEGVPDELGGLVLITLNGFAILRNIAFIFGYFMAEKVNVFDCACRDCGHTWQWRSDQPLPVAAAG